MEPVSVYNTLSHEAKLVAKYGIERAEAVVAQKGLIVILRASQTLWLKMEAAVKFSYPSDLVAALGTLSTAIWPQIESGAVSMMPAEPTMIGLAERVRPGGLELTGVYQEGDYYHVPNSVTAIGWQTKNEDPDRANPYLTHWVQWLNTPRMFDEEPGTPEFVEFVVLPPRTPSVTDCVIAIELCCGWNYHGILPREHRVKLAKLLLQNLREATHLG